MFFKMYLIKKTTQQPKNPEKVLHKTYYKLCHYAAQLTSEVCIAYAYTGYRSVDSEARV